MNFRSTVTATISGLILFVGIVQQSEAQQAPSTGTQLLITDTRVAPQEGSLTGTLYIRMRGREQKIAREVIEAWIIRDGRQVVYSGMDGSGGFENEGQSLRIYDPRTGTRRKILSEYFGVN